MDRRGFLRCIAVTITASMAPSVVFAEASEQVSPHVHGVEYGNAIGLLPSTVYTPDVIESVVRKVLLLDAKKTIGHGVIEIRASVPTNYGLNRSIAWYTNDAIMGMKPEIVPKPILLAGKGFIYCGRIAI